MLLVFGALFRMGDNPSWKFGVTLVPGVWCVLRALRAAFGFAARDLPARRPFWLVDFLLFAELRRAVRSLTVGLRLLALDKDWVRVTGKIRAWDDPNGPFLLDGDSGEYWVDAGLTHTFLATPGTPAVGDKVQVLGRVQGFQQSGAFRGTDRKTLSGDALAPLTIIAPSWRPVPWIFADAAVAILGVIAYAACLASIVRT
jgi:hypothetical protein